MTQTRSMRWKDVPPCPRLTVTPVLAVSEPPLVPLPTQPFLRVSEHRMATWRCLCIPRLDKLHSPWLCCYCRSVVSDSSRCNGLQPTRLLYPWDSPGKNTGVGCHFLLQGIVPTQGSNPRLLHCYVDSFSLKHLLGYCPAEDILTHLWVRAASNPRLCPQRAQQMVGAV